MKFLTKEILSKLPPIGATENDKNAKAILKLFNPSGIGNWWIFEHDPVERIFFGVAEIQEREV